MCSGTGKGEIGNVGAAINNAAECIHMFLTERQSSEKLMSALYLNRADKIWILRFVSDIFPRLTGLEPVSVLTG